MITLSPRYNLNIFYTAKARAVHLKLKFGPDTPFLWLEDLLSLVSLCPGRQSGVDSSDGDEVAISQGKGGDPETLSIWLGQVTHGIWGDLKEKSEYPSFLVILLAS